MRNIEIVLETVLSKKEKRKGSPWTFKCHHWIQRTKILMDILFK